MMDLSKKRDTERLRALRNADEALYELWKKCYINEPLMAALNNLQTHFIHVEIRKLATKEPQR
jgi:hypothetical protein